MIGFSTGALKHLLLPTVEKVKLLSQLNTQLKAKAIEVSFNRPERGFFTITEEELTTIEEAVSAYRYISTHAPTKGGIRYRSNKKTAEILDRLNWIANVLNSQLIVFHANGFDDFGILERVGFPVAVEVAVENTDGRKKPGQLPGDGEPVLQANPSLGLVLDITHVAVVDPQLDSMDYLLEKFGARIREIHLSGYGPDGDHLPLYQTGQTEIVEAYQKAKKLDVPVILEGNVDPERAAEELTKELKFIRNL